MTTYTSDKRTYDAYLKSGLWEQKDSPKYVKGRKASALVSAKLKNSIERVDIIVEIIDYYHPSIFSNR